MTSVDALPEDWRWATLGEVCRQERVSVTSDSAEYLAMPYLGLEHIEAETGRILVTEEDARQSSARSNNFRFTATHVLYGKLRPYLNKVALPSFSGRCSTEIVPLMPSGADREWLAWLLRHESTVAYAMRGKTGSRMPRTSMRDLMGMPIALPPMDEQRRIVLELQQQLAAVERARKAAQAHFGALDAMPAALLRHAFTPRVPS